LLGKKWIRAIFRRCISMCSPVCSAASEFGSTFACERVALQMCHVYASADVDSGQDRGSDFELTACAFSKKEESKSCFAA
jgi:hypothetical protein